MTEQLGLLDATPPEPLDERSSFRPIHYLGGKSRLLDEIAASIESADPSQGRLLDLFAGSGVVSARLANARSVVAVDIQEYARVLCSALLDPCAPTTSEAHEAIASASESSALRTLTAALEPLVEYEEWALRTAGHDADLLCALVEHGSLAVGDTAASGSRPELLTKAVASVLGRAASPFPPSGLPWSIAYHYGGVYFSYRQACDFDVLLAAVPHIPSECRDSWLAAVLSTASEVVTSVGNQFAQPLRPRGPHGEPKPQAIRLVCRQRAHDVTRTFLSWLNRYRTLRPATRGHLALRADFRDYLAETQDDVTVVYADPPYTRDHYSRFYHVLETMARRDAPGVSMMRVGGRTRPSRGIYRAERHQSPFCIKSEAPQAFRTLFAGVRARRLPLVLSYSPYSEEKPSHPRLLTVHEVQRLAREHFTSVSIETIDAISHSKFNTARRNFERSSGAEVLITCRP